MRKNAGYSGVLLPTCFMIPHLRVTLIFLVVFWLIPGNAWLLDQVVAFDLVYLADALILAFGAVTMTYCRKAVGNATYRER